MAAIGGSPADLSALTTPAVTEAGGWHRRDDVVHFGGLLGSGRGSAWLERLVRDQEAGGSNPLAPTTFSSRSVRGGILARTASSQTDRQTARFLVNGRVQGVGYRYFVLREAQALGVDGYVHNLADGSVEVVAEATSATLRALADRLAEGPAFAEVTSVERAAIPALRETGFTIR